LNSPRYGTAPHQWGFAARYVWRSSPIYRALSSSRANSSPGGCPNLSLLYEESDPARAAELMSALVAYEREIGHPDAEADAERVARIQARL
jgi:hypothetical protein